MVCVVGGARGRVGRRSGRDGVRACLSRVAGAPAEGRACEGRASRFGCDTPRALIRGEVVSPRAEASKTVHLETPSAAAAMARRAGGEVALRGRASEAPGRRPARPSRDALTADSPRPSQHGRQGSRERAPPGRAAPLTLPPGGPGSKRFDLSRSRERGAHERRAPPPELLKNLALSNREAHRHDRTAEVCVGVRRAGRFKFRQKDRRRQYKQTAPKRRAENRRTRGAPITPPTTSSSTSATASPPPAAVASVETRQSYSQSFEQY